MRHRRKARKQAAQARAKVDAAKLVQRVVRGHWARREYAVRVAEREETRPQMDASNVLKASALRWLYQAAYQAAMVELARQAQRLALALVLVPASWVAPFWAQSTTEGPSCTRVLGMQALLALR